MNIKKIFFHHIYLLNLIYFFIFLAHIPSLSYASSRLILSKSSFSQLPDWEKDNLVDAFRAFTYSCTALLKRAHSPNLYYSISIGNSQQWETICIAADKLKVINQITTRRFFEYWFEPYQVSDGIYKEGLFTGYYLPTIHARLKANKEYIYPIYGLPNDLIKIDLGLFNADLAGKNVVGRLTKERSLTPYFDRNAIDQGILKKKAPVLAWSNNLIDIFFAQIQGSAIVELENKKLLLLGYAGKNGRPYTSIGKVLVNANQLSKETISMQTIREWLIQHPNQLHDILNQNASYVFFKILKEKNPLGTQLVPLTKGRSLAVDPRYIPLGAPMWVSTRTPSTSPVNTLFRHLLIAQDTGGAVKGIVRGDLYLGSGEDAAYVAGHMKNSGQYWILLPRIIKN